MAKKKQSVEIIDLEKLPKKQIPDMAHQACPNCLRDVARPHHKLHRIVQCDHCGHAFYFGGERDLI